MRPITFAQTSTITAQIHPNAIKTRAFQDGLAELRKTHPGVTIGGPSISFQMKGAETQIRPAQRGMIRLLRASHGTGIQTTA